MQTLTDLTVVASSGAADTFVWVLSALEVLALLSVPSVLLRRRGRPIAALAWLFGLFALPGLGTFAWWAIGRTTLERRRRKRVIKKRAFSERHEGPIQEHGTNFDDFFPPRARGEATFSSSGNQVRLLTDGKDYFPRLEASLAEAKLSIHMEMYIFQLDRAGERILTLLEQQARKGLDVRLLLDGFGSQQTAHRIKRRLEKSGAKVALFLPSRIFPLHSPRLNFINHRKIVVVDQRLAFTGGMNIGDQYATDWRDLMLEVAGPAVRSLHHVLLDDWFFATDEACPEPETPAAIPGGCEMAVVASGPDTEGWIHDAYFLAITEARRRITIVTPYFIPSQALLTALRTAAGRGVDVRIILPSTSDVTIVKWASRSYYRELVDVGVRIFEYGGPMLHAKALIQDSQIVSVGTANVDTRSMGLSFEVSCFLYDTSLHQTLETWFGRLEAGSVEVLDRHLNAKTLVQKLGESAAHLLSPIL